MANIWFISDTHFGHANTFLKFKGPDGKPMRPFSSVEEMDEIMVQRWNEVVRPQDKVYHLGDVIVRNSNQQILGRLMGHKRLILGNHDNLDIEVYAKYFEKIFSSRRMDSIMFTHIPIHPQGIIPPKLIANVHGHLHNNQHRTLHELPCPPYLNISVELTDYRPIDLCEVKHRLFGG